MMKVVFVKKSGQSVTSSLQFVKEVNLRRNWIGSNSLLKSVVIARKVLSKIHIPTDKIFVGTYHLGEPFYEFEEIISTCNHQLWGLSLSVLSLPFSYANSHLQI